MIQLGLVTWFGFVWISHILFDHSIRAELQIMQTHETSEIPNVKVSEANWSWVVWCPLAVLFARPSVFHISIFAELFYMWINICIRASLCSVLFVLPCCSPSVFDPWISIAALSGASKNPSTIVMLEESILRKLGLHSDQPFIRFTCLRPLLDNLRQLVCSVHYTAPKFTTFVKWFRKDKQPHSVIFGRKGVMINPEGRKKHRKRRKHAFRIGIFRPKKVRSNLSFRK